MGNAVSAIVRTRRPAVIESSRVVAVVVALVVSVAACGGPDGDDAAAPSDAPTVGTVEPLEFGLVSPAESVALVESGVTVIDVRTPEEYAEGHLEGAALIDFYDADFADQLAELPADQEYLVYCRSGNRSGQAAQIMKEQGFEQVYDLEGGVLEYAAEGFPLTP
jgi:rhodanese-related sulfurtransferase